MTNKLFPSVYLVWLSVLGLAHCQQIQSPCPSLFQYASDGIENYGLIYFAGAQIGQTYVLDLQMTVQGRLPTTFYGEISLIDGKETTLGNIIKNKPVTYKVSFPVQNQLPEVTAIRINNNLICSGRNSLSGSVTKLSLQHILQTSVQIPLSYTPSPVVPQTMPGLTNYADPRQQYRPSQQQPQFVTPSSAISQLIYSQPPKPSTQVDTQPIVVTRSEVPQSPVLNVTPPNVINRSQVPSSVSTVNKICGTSAVIARPLVIGGEAIERGSWPWLVAVYLNDAKGLSFKCGGNLVTSRTVITAAHCLKLRGSEHKAKNVLIVAGRHNLLDWSESTSITFNAERVEIHPDYKDNLQSFDADVAIVIVEQTISFDNYIRPVCLWHEDADVHMVEGQSGVIVGWGKDENREVSPEPKKVSSKIVSGETCLRSNDQFYQITSSRTFCAGNQNGEGPCTGDSGGGFMMERNGRWTLRGTVSGALAEANSENCDLKQYVIYSDIAKFTSWIYSNIVY